MAKRIVSTQRTMIIIEDGLTDLPNDDLSTVIDVLVAAGAVAAYMLGSGIYIGFTNSDGEAVAYLHSAMTHLTVTGRAASVPTHLRGRATRHSSEPGGYDVFLSGWQGDGSRSTPVVLRFGAPCPTCNTFTPTATGYCEACG